MPSLDPDVADLARSGPGLTEYDEQHTITYMRPAGYPTKPLASYRTNRQLSG